MDPKLTSVRARILLMLAEIQATCKPGQPRPLRVPQCVTDLTLEQRKKLRERLARLV